MYKPNHEGKHIGHEVADYLLGKSVETHPGVKARLEELGYYDLPVYYEGIVLTPTTSKSRKVRNMHL